MDSFSCIKARPHSLNPQTAPKIESLFIVSSVNQTPQHTGRETERQTEEARVVGRIRRRRSRRREKLMSLRYASRLVLQGGTRAREAATRSIKDAAASANSAGSTSSSTSRQARRFTSALDSNALKSAVADEKRKKAEESLRTVMFLSCWGPN